MVAEKPKVVLLLAQDLYDEFMVPPVVDALAAFDVLHVPGARTEDELLEALQGAAGCITSWRSPQLTRRVIEGAAELRIIGHAAGSVKGYVDPAAWDRGIVVVNAARVIAPYVGEMALLLTLAALRNLPQNDRALRSGVRWKPNAWTHTDTLFGKTVGLVGFGATAREFAALLAPFRTKLLVYDPYASEDDVRAFGARLVPLEELLRTADVVSLHAASTPETKGLISAERLALMKDGAILINTARGALVDEEALVAEVRRGRLKAALDVFAQEPLADDHPLRSEERCIITPHLAGPVTTERWRMLLAIALDFRRYLIEGEPLPHVVLKRHLEIGA